MIAVDYELRLSGQSPAVCDRCHLNKESGIAFSQFAVKCFGIPQSRPDTDPVLTAKSKTLDEKALKQAIRGVFERRKRAKCTTDDLFPIPTLTQRAGI